MGPRGLWPLVSVIVVNYRRPDLAAATLDSLQRCTYPALEVVLVDDDADVDDGPLWESYCPGVKYVRSGTRLGRARATNVGIARSSADLVLALGPTTVVEPDFLEPMVMMLRGDSRVGIVSPHVVVDGERDRGEEVGLLSGACMLARRTLFDPDYVGGLAECYATDSEQRDFAGRARRFGFVAAHCSHALVSRQRSPCEEHERPREIYHAHLDRVALSRRLLDGWSFAAFAVRYLSVEAPLSAWRYARRGCWANARAVARALWWHATHATPA